MAILARYALDDTSLALPDYLDGLVFRSSTGETCHPDTKDAEGFEAFMKRYRAALSAEKALAEGLR